MWWPEEGTEYFGVEVAGNCGMPGLLYGCWNPNSSLQDWTAISLATDPSLQLQYWFLFVLLFVILLYFYLRDHDSYSTVTIKSKGNNFPPVLDSCQNI